jgi:hypothetical protein
MGDVDFPGLPSRGRGTEFTPGVGTGTVLDQIEAFLTG